MKHVIIGNGIAGVRAAEAIRELDQQAEIVMVGDETFPPYSRPMISNVLEGSQIHNRLPIRPKNFYDKLAIHPLLGQRINRLDVNGKRIGWSNDRWVDFDKLLIAAGADPRPIKAEGLHLDNIFYMRTENHVKAQLQALKDAQHALVLGGGLVGFKAAYGLIKRGIEVTMLITSGYPLSLQVDERAGKLIIDELLRHGLKVRVGASVCAFQGNGAVRAAITNSGDEIPCDLVIIGKGVLPALDFVRGNGVHVDLGIVVNPHMQSNIPDIYAAGDAAETYDIARKKPWVNAIWPEAAAQGSVAGANMAGRPVSYRGSLGRNVMRIFDLDVMTLGYANAKDTETFDILYSENAMQKCYRSLVLRENKIVGAVLINRIEQGGVLRALIENQVPITMPPGDLLSPTFNYSRLM
jgi:NAD(P)H-nitrite reductase large subunit